MHDVDAIRRLKRGEIDGLEILVTRHQARAVRTAYLITQDQSLAEDVAQDTFLRIFQPPITSAPLARSSRPRPLGGISSSVVWMREISTVTDLAAAMIV